MLICVIQTQNRLLFGFLIYFSETILTRLKMRDCVKCLIKSKRHSPFSLPKRKIVPIRYFAKNENMLQ